MKLPRVRRRLCVETAAQEELNKSHQPAAFRRLCVETQYEECRYPTDTASRLQAAVC